MQIIQFCALIFGVALSSKAATSPHQDVPFRLKSVRVLPTNGQNPYSGYALPQGYNQNQMGYNPNTGASTNGYPYQSQPGAAQNPSYSQPRQQFSNGGGVYPYDTQTGASSNYKSNVEPTNSRQSIKNNPRGINSRFVQTTLAPASHGEHHGKGLYLAMFLILPCVIGGCCIGRMFFMPKQGLSYPEPILFAQGTGDLSNPAGQSYDSNIGRSYSEQAWRPSSHKPSDRVTQSAHDLYNIVPEQRETPGQSIYDYGGTPNPPKNKSDPLAFLQKLV